jgi:hypothetical protein
MSRIPPVDPSSVPPEVSRVLDAQAKKWGAPLANHLVYARLPALFRGVRGMWGALGQLGLIDLQLESLINRRVAAHNGCLF